jgi:hypothetical protein
MAWTLHYIDYYEEWLEAQEEDLQDEAIAQLGVLEEYGPNLGRPWVDTLKGSKISNLKEVRFSYKGAPIRILFAFDPRQQGVIILGGDKTGDKRWYKTNIPIAEKLYAEHLEKQKKETKQKVKKKRTIKRGKGDDYS